MDEDGDFDSRSDLRGVLMETIVFEDCGSDVCCGACGRTCGSKHLIWSGASDSAGISCARHGRCRCYGLGAQMRPRQPEDPDSMWMYVKRKEEARDLARK